MRGVITSRTGRSARRTTPEMIARSLSSITPDFDASATIRCSSSAVTRFSESRLRSEEHTSELQSLMRISYAVFCLKKKKKTELYNTNKCTIMTNNKTNITTQEYS